MRQGVDVIALYEKNGKIKPLYIVWSNGVRYQIDRITQIIPGTSLKDGNTGVRYTCRIGSHQRYLYLDDGHWYVERTEAVFS